MGKTWTVGSSTADFLTLTSAEANVDSGDALILMPGALYEDVILRPDISLFSYGGTTIFGKCSVVASGEVKATNINFITQGDFALDLSGSNSPQFNLTNCSIVALDHTAINLSASGALAALTAMGCIVSIATPGYTFYDMSGGNNIHFMNCFLNNNGSTAASNNSCGNALIEYSTSFGSFSNTGSGSFGAFNCNIDTSGIPTTPIYMTGTGANVISNCYVGAGSVVCYYVTPGKTLTVAKTYSNTSNVIYTGGGTVNIV